jgi:hypothetical protein
MPLITGASEILTGRFRDKGGFGFNVKHPDFGAKGDGIDDTTALQAAINAAVAVGGGTVYLPDGAFRATSSLALSGNVVFEASNRAATSLIGPAGAPLFVGSGVVTHVEFNRITLSGNGAGSRLFTMPAFGGGNNWQNGRITIDRCVVQDFGDYAIVVGQSVYFVDVRRTLFQRNVGSIDMGVNAELAVEECFFYQPAVNATYPSGLPQLRLIGGSTCHVRKSAFVHSSGASTEPDIEIRADNSAGQSGFIEVNGNKFGPEGEVTARKKIRCYNPANVGHASYGVKLLGNDFLGAGAGQTAIQLLNPIQGWLVDDNYFAGFSTIIDDAFALTSTDAGHSVFGPTNRAQAPGGSSPNTAITQFTNGGRGFSRIYPLDGTAQLRVDPVPVVPEAAELRNRLLQSEDLSSATWLKTGVTVTGSQTDPWGGTSAYLLTRTGSVAGENIRCTVDNTGLKNRLFTKFWAKKGTLDTIQIGVFDVTTQLFQGSLYLFALTNDWQLFDLAALGIAPADTYRLQVYPGNSSQTPAANPALVGGTLYLCKPWVADYPESVYYPTTGAAAAETTAGTRFQQRVILGGGVSHGTKTVTTTYTATGNDALVRADATGGAFTVTLPSAAAVPGLRLTFKKIDASANAVTISRAGTNTIDGATTKTLTTQYQTLSLQSNGTGWDVL